MMMMPYPTIFPISLISPILAISLSSSHFLMILLYLEAMNLLNLAMFIMLTNLNSPLNPTFIFMILTLSACEASLGLTLLVLLVRSSGNDNVKTLSPSRH